MKQKALSLLLVLAICATLFVPALADGLTAKPTAASVFVDGETIAFDAYHIEGNNYFKLRDLAYVLNGTDKQFSVEWDGEAQKIILVSGEEYTPDGSEMQSKGEDSKVPTTTSSTIVIDDEEVELIAYHIEGNNYFKLRDIGKQFDIFIGWDGTNIHVETTREYDYDNEDVNVEVPVAEPPEVEDEEDGDEPGDPAEEIDEDIENTGDPAVDSEDEEDADPAE